MLDSKPPYEFFDPTGIRSPAWSELQTVVHRKQVGDRYNYLYSPAELEPWVDRIKEVAAKTKETYAVTNNHLNGQAAVNALEIASFLSGEPVEVPEPLVERYPRLQEIAAAT